MTENPLAGKTHSEALAYVINIVNTAYRACGWDLPLTADAKPSNIAAAIRGLPYDAQQTEFAPAT